MTPTDIENARGAIRAVRESATGRGTLGPAALNCAAMLERALADRRSILDTLASLVADYQAVVEPRPRRAMPDWLDYDEATDVLTIDGHRYARDVFGPEGLHSVTELAARIEPGPGGDTTVVTRLHPMSDEEIASAMTGYGPTGIGFGVLRRIARAFERHYRIGEPR